MRIKTGFLDTGIFEKLDFLLIVPDTFWGTVSYPFWVYFLHFEFSVFLISALESDPPLATLIPEDQWFVMIKYRFYQKIGNAKLCNFFYSRKREFFSENTGFLDTGTWYRSESWKFGSADKSYVYNVKIILIVLKEDFGSISLVRYLLMHLMQIQS